jgi:hypothetical protein
MKFVSLDLRRQESYEKEPGLLKGTLTLEVAGGIIVMEIGKSSIASILNELEDEVHGMVLHLNAKEHFE